MNRSATSPSAARRRPQPGGLWAQVPGRLLRNPAAVAGLGIILVAIAVAAYAPELTPHDPTRMYVAAQSLPPAWVQGTARTDGGDPRFLLGTDASGRDILSRAVYGLRPALVIGIEGALGAALLGGMLGLLAGYAERGAGRALMAVIGVVSALPALMSYVLLYRILYASAVAPTLGREGVVVLPFVLIQWVSAARVVHARVLSVKQELYVEAARSIGAGHPRILFRHIFPACVNLIATWTAVTVPQLIVLEAILGYLGVGVYLYGDESARLLFTITWGKMMESGHKTLFTNPMQVLAPALAVTTIAMAFTLVGDGLRDALEPGSRR